MRIISKSLKYNHLVRNAVIDMVVDNEGRKVPMVIKPQIWLEFSQNGITRYDHQYAAQHWGGHNRDSHDGTADGWGAHPDPREGALNGVIHLGWRPWMTLSVFDTDNMEPGSEQREVVEEYFTTHPIGQDWIVVEPQKLVPPWPTYDSMQWKRIGPMAHDLGLAAVAFEYEAATKAREPVLKALQEEHAKQVETDAEDAALTGIIVP